MKLDQEIRPVGRHNRNTRSRLLLVCEHAGCAIPSSLSNLGLSDDVIHDHVGWDIGAYGFAERLANHQGAELIYQRISRLVIDCNRQLGCTTLIPKLSEYTKVPGNMALTDRQRHQRIEEIWAPFQDAINQSLDRRLASKIRSVLVAVHSFNPVYQGVKRPWHVCLAYNRDDRLAKLLYEDLKSTCEQFEIALNKPFSVTDEEDQTIPAFGEARSIPHVLLEIRNDLLQTENEQLDWATRIGSALQRCIEYLDIEEH